MEIAENNIREKVWEDREIALRYLEELTTLIANKRRMPYSDNIVISSTELLNLIYKIEQTIIVQIK